MEICVVCKTTVNLWDMIPSEPWRGSHWLHVKHIIGGHMCNLAWLALYRICSHLPSPDVSVVTVGPFVFIVLLVLSAPSPALTDSEQWFLTLVSSNSWGFGGSVSVSGVK